MMLLTKWKSVLKNLDCERLGLFLLIVYPIFNSVFVNYLPFLNDIFIIFEIVFLFVFVIGCFFKRTKQVVFISLIYLFILVIELLLRRNTDVLYLLKEICLSSYLIIIFGSMYEKIDDFELDIYNISITCLYILSISVLINIKFYMEITGNWLGYQTLLPFCIVLFWCYKSRRIDLKSGVALFLGCPLLFLGGTRTPLLLSFILFIICFGSYLYNRRKIFFSFFIGFSSILAILFFPMMKLIDEYLLSKGILIRIIHLFADLNIASLFNFSNRFSSFYIPIFNRLLEVPLFGLGLGGDRIILCESINETTCTFQMASGYYSHNIILEILQQFGLIVGFITLLCIIIIIVYMIKRKKGVLPFVFAAFIPLLLSSSWISYAPFWLFISYFLITIKNDRRARHLIKIYVERGKIRWVKRSKI